MRKALVIALLLAACAPTGLKGRLANSERRGGAAEGELDDAEKAMRDLDSDEAQKHLVKAKGILAEPDMDLYPERDMLRDRLVADSEQLPGIKTAREKHDLEVAVTD